MADVVPDLRMTAGAPFSAAWQFLESDQAPIDLSLWNGVCAFRRRTEVIATVPLETTPAGDVILSLSAPQVDALVGPNINFRITLTPSNPELVEVWIGSVIVE